jgi:imidazolonepropionase
VAETYLLRGARQLLTLRGVAEPRRGTQLGDLSIINDGALLIRDGRIEEVGPTRRVENLKAARDAKVLDATGRVVTPAFVDSGVNLVFSHSAAERNEERLHAGKPRNACDQREDILHAVRALRMISSQRLGMRAEAMLAAMARHGTCSLGVVSGFGLDYTGELKSLRVAKALNGEPLDLFSTYLGGNTLPEDFDGNADGYIDKVVTRIFPVIVRRRLARFAAIRCSAGGLDLASARRFLSMARGEGLQVSLHSQQFARDESVRLALEHNAISMTHLEHLSDHDAGELAKSRTTAILTPAATFHMGLTRFAPARQLIDRGAAVVLASGFNPDDCPTFSMAFVLVLACRYLGMTAAEAITAATINAACVHGKGAEIGSLEIGKKADLLILNARDYRDIPQQPGVNLVHTVMKRGRIIHGPGHTAE